ncbi:hemolysin activation/secretion protein [Cupriavidus metallidurans]|jgi:hemolysin activation/secretion protein|uniref:ShlB/FhaC/HecB family hemolysin secretion/activation protein n=1 Tax=Cupriavidus TaxID=106589 RepID=UPI0004933B85|nr:ShlB/FhaC/HecB family hemolysin secretion/activation protein [Cupriavidus metallidurans]AVA35688.1 ShlB/FhaC/HecB family hemolysin secretion/activation protein [Cupriavidus metallidurans]MDE4921658.1 ShlB/FhaC/HecB family hemolysin secretion/activation protein [Cupriavidus metallidurans]UBM08678.1 ShlB/FhaC/HecB family hemolysin secretion/activation protein [Cupriavidus metallidurans]
MRIKSMAMTRPLHASLLLLGLSTCAEAQPTGPGRSPATTAADQQQLTRQQQEARERAQAIEAPGVRAQEITPLVYPTLPTETPCFRIDRFVLEVPADLPDSVQVHGASTLPMDPFAFARAWLDHYQGACVGRQGLDMLTMGVSQAILSRGYVTTRVLLPQQDLSTGTLRLALIPGVIGELRFAEPDTRGTWKSAFPARSGDLLNLRDLEQGLEQMKRVASQDAEMQIVPTAVPGVSDVVIAVKRAKAWTVVASIDNSGTEATGKWLGNLSLGIDNPLGLNDLFNVGYMQDVELGNRKHGTHGWNGFYSVPWGYWTGTLSAYSNTYYQQIAGVNQTFVSSGNSQTVDMKLQRVIRRSQSDVLGLQFRLSRRFGESFIEDTAIPQQRRNNTFVEAGFTDRHYFGSAQFDGSLVYRQGIGGFGSQADTLAVNGGPTWRYSMVVADANLSAPFRLGDQMLRYVTTFRGQYTGDRLYALDMMTIGSRYTVRGFDGEMLLAGDSGFYWRNELQAPVANTGQALYAGLDYGRVFGPSTVGLVGTQLIGAVLGLRGGFGSKFGRLSYDFFVGLPVYKPAAFHTSGVTGGMQVAYQY